MSESYRVTGQPIDSMSPVTREVEANGKDQAKEKYLDRIGHKNVYSLRASEVNE